jgi:predicted enzyme related to lactoylglutathione lyase
MADPIFPRFLHSHRKLTAGRLLLPAIGAALLAAPLNSAGAQGSCGGARVGTPQCNTTPAKAPFEPTGWKTTALDHFTMHAVDYKKEAAYYMALMNWKLRSDDGKQAVLDVGDIGTVVIVGGYTPPPPPPPRVLSPADSAALVAAQAARAGGAGGAGGRGAGAGRGAGGGGARGPAQVVWDSFAWTISPWNAKTVEAELKKRGLNPVADNSGPKGCESFHVKDPDGFDLQISNACYSKERKTPIKPVANWNTPAPFEATNWKTVWLDHISFGVSDYKGEVAFYEALIGWKPTGDEGSQNEVWMCDDCGNSLIRGGNSLAPGFDPNAPRRASIGHVSFGFTPFDSHGTLDELTKRGLTGRPDTGAKGDIHSDSTSYKSYHTPTPQGFDLQISNATKANRTVR